MASTAAVAAARNAQRGQITSPAPGATETRTDQGVDWSNVKSINAVGAGVITAIQSGLQGWGTRIIERLQSPITGPKGEPESQVYYAEESGGGPPQVKVGQTVQQGQQLAPGTGGGIEVGITDPGTGEALGRTEGYKEGDVTAAGRAFRSDISGNPPITRPGGGSSDPSGGSDGAAVDKLFTDYQSEVNMDRTAPALAGPKWATPFQWWWQSFTGKWDAELAGSSAGGGDTAPGDPTGAGAKILKTITGKGSFFNDGTTATGKSAVTTPGIAVYDQSTLGGWWRVTAPNGMTKIEQQIDIGPAPWTRRIVDIGAAALGDFGYSSSNFPTDQGSWRLDYLGKNKP